MNIVNILEEKGLFGVLADQHGSVVRLWTLSSPFKDGRTLKALKKFFPCLEVTGKMIRLGGYNTLVEAQHDLALAKVYSFSKGVQNLFRFDTEESLATLKNISH